MILGNVIRSPIAPPLNFPDWKVSGSGFPASLALLWPVRPSLTGAQKSAVGPAPEWSYTGAQYDADGVSVGAVPAWHTGKGVWCGPGFTQSVQNPSCAGAIVGTPGTLPTGWRKLENGCVVSVVGVGDGYVDVRVNGTATSANVVYVMTAHVSAAAGQTWTGSVTLVRLAGAWPSASRVTMRERFVSDNSISAISGDGEYVLTRTLTNGSTSGVEIYISFDATGATDVTFRISKPNLTQTAIKMPYVNSPVTVPSAAGTSGGNGLAWAKSAKMLETLRGKKDGVELVNFSAAPALIAVSGACVGAYAPETRTLSVTTADAACFTYPRFRFNLSGSPAVGDRLSVRIEFSNSTNIHSVRLRIVTDAALTLTKNGNVYSGEVTLSTLSDLMFEIITIGTSVWSTQIISATVQRYTKPTSTVAAVVTLGASSTDTTADTNILSAKDTTVGLLYLASGGTIKSNDGSANTATVTVTGGWAAGQKLLIVLEYGPTTYRVGYLKVGTETTLTWGTAATFDGSFDPLTKMRAAINNALPRHIAGVEMWMKTGVSLADIEKQFKAVGVL